MQKGTIQRRRPREHHRRGYKRRDGKYVKPALVNKGIRYAPKRRNLSIAKTRKLSDIKEKPKNI